MFFNACLFESFELEVGVLIMPFEMREYPKITFQSFQKRSFAQGSCVHEFLRSSVLQKPLSVLRSKVMRF